MLGSLPPLLVLPILELLAAAPAPAHAAPAPAPWQLSPRQGGAAAYPVSVARAAAGRGYGFTHAWDELYSGTMLVNGVPYQVRVAGRWSPSGGLRCGADVGDSGYGQ